VALVQPGNIEDSVVRQAAGEALTEDLRGRRLDLVVWGESSVGVDLTGDRDAVARLAGLSSRVGADLVVNVDARDRTGGISKSSVLIGPGGIRGTYRKTRLVPFGEYVPLRPLFGWATRHTKAAAEDRRRGSGIIVLYTEDLALGPLISFETTFSDLPRELVARGAQLLVYQSSTSTYQGSWAQPQLASMVAVHAAEVGHPAVHTGLSGVSSAFDARGRQLGWYAATESGVLVVDVPLGSHTTTFGRSGNWVLAMALSIFACGIAVAAVRYRVARHTTRRAG
jgi:apolipoprotein N-acyltransferase